MLENSAPSKTMFPPPPIPVDVGLMYEQRSNQMPSLMTLEQVVEALEEITPQSYQSIQATLAAAIKPSPPEQRRFTNTPGGDQRDRKPFELNPETEQGILALYKADKVPFDTLAKAVEKAGGPRKLWLRERLAQITGADTCEAMSSRPVRDGSWPLDSDHFAAVESISQPLHHQEFDEQRFLDIASFGSDGQQRPCDAPRLASTSALSLEACPELYHGSFYALSPTTTRSSADSEYRSDCFNRPFQCYALEMEKDREDDDDDNGVMNLKPRVEKSRSKIAQQVAGAGPEITNTQNKQIMEVTKPDPRSATAARRLSLDSCQELPIKNDHWNLVPFKLTLQIHDETHILIVPSISLPVTPYDNGQDEESKVLERYHIENDGLAGGVPLAAAGIENHIHNAMPSSFSTSIDSKTATFRDISEQSWTRYSPETPNDLACSTVERAVGEDTNEEFHKTDLLSDSLGVTSMNVEGKHLSRTDFSPCQSCSVEDEDTAKGIRDRNYDRQLQCQCSQKFSGQYGSQKHMQTIQVDEENPIEILEDLETTFQRQMRARMVRSYSMSDVEKGSRRTNNTGTERCSLSRPLDHADLEDAYRSDLALSAVRSFTGPGRMLSRLDQLLTEYDACVEDPSRSSQEDDFAYDVDDLDVLTKTETCKSDDSFLSAGLGAGFGDASGRGTSTSSMSRITTTSSSQGSFASSQWQRINGPGEDEESDNDIGRPQKARKLSDDQDFEASCLREMIPCTQPDCQGQNASVSEWVRKLEHAHKIFICTRCFKSYQNDDRKTHREKECEERCVCGNQSSDIRSSGITFAHPRIGACATNRKDLRKCQYMYICRLLNAEPQAFRKGSARPHKGEKPRTRQQVGSELTVEARRVRDRNLHLEMRNNMKDSRIQDLEKKVVDLENIILQFQELTAEKGLHLPRSLMQRINGHALHMPDLNPCSKPNPAYPFPEPFGTVQKQVVHSDPMSSWQYSNITFDPTEGNNMLDAQADQLWPLEYDGLENATIDSLSAYNDLEPVLLDVSTQNGQSE